VQARRPARGRPSACPTLRAVFAVVEACAACRRSARSRSAGVVPPQVAWPPSSITTDGAATRPLAVGAQRVVSGSRLTPQAGQRCAGMASAFTSQVRDYRASARARRGRALLLRGRRGSRLGGIPSFSAAVSETQSSAVSVESAATARLGVAIRLLGQLDHAEDRGWRLAARHWPQFRQIVVPMAGSVVGQRIEGVLPRPSAAQAACSVSCAQPEQ
jgi:hypothetical protein